MGDPLFGLLYGMKTGSLQFRLNKTQEEATEICEKYWGTFPRVLPWLRETVEEMYKHKMIRYWSGRIWREDNPDHFYKGCNAQVQGGAADLIQLAVIRAQKMLQHQGWGNVASIIHDEILCEVKDEYVAEAIPVLIRIMELEDVFGLPFKAEAKTGKTYGDLEDYPVDVDVSTIEWKNWMAPDTDYSKLSLRPWKEVYGGTK
jgi:DNA polymerase I-like protein with 3'-5' exonuclease and polymerase domains